MCVYPLILCRRATPFISTIKTFIRLVHVFLNAHFFYLCNVFNAISQNAHINRWIATDRLYVRYESGRGCLDKLVIFWVNMNEIRSSSASYEHIVPGLKHGFIKIDVRYCLLELLYSRIRTLFLWIVQSIYKIKVTWFMIHTLTLQHFFHKRGIQMVWFPCKNVIVGLSILMLCPLALCRHACQEAGWTSASHCG